MQLFKLPNMSSVQLDLCLVPNPKKQKLSLFISNSYNISDYLKTTHLTINEISNKLSDDTYRNLY